MAETLSQEEIDALRDAVKSGETLAEEEAPEQNEDQIRVISYDFRKPRLLSSDQLHALQLIHETAGKELQATLLSRLKMPIEIKLVAVDQISYGEFVLSLSNPTYLVLFSTKPHTGNAVMEIGLSAVMPIIDSLLGGDGSSPEEPRELTALETSIFRSITDTCLKTFREAWSSTADIAFEILTEQSNPETLQLTTPESSCLSMTFDVHLGEATGVLDFCYPFTTIQSIYAEARKRSGSTGVAGSGSKGNSNDMINALSVAPLEAHVVLGSGVLQTEHVGLLKAGDVLCLDRRHDEPVDVYVGENKVFRAAIGQHRGKAAAMVLETSAPGLRTEMQTDEKKKVTHDE